MATHEDKLMNQPALASEVNPIAKLKSDIMHSLNMLEARSAQSKSELENMIVSATSALNLLDARSSSKTELISTANATDLASAITLVNEIKAKLNLMNS